MIRNLPIIIYMAIAIPLGIWVVLQHDDDPACDPLPTPVQCQQH